MALFCIDVHSGSSPILTLLVRSRKGPSFYVPALLADPNVRVLDSRLYTFPISSPVYCFQAHPLPHVCLRARVSITFGQEVHPKLPQATQPASH